MRAQALAHVDAGAGHRRGQGDDAIVLTWLHGQTDGAAADLDELGVHAGGSVEGQRQLAQALDLAALELVEERAVEVVEFLGAEDLAVEVHAHVVGVDVEVDGAGATQDRGLDQLQHIAPGVGELELLHLEPSLLAVEGELTLRVDRALGA